MVKPPGCGGIDQLRENPLVRAVVRRPFHASGDARRVHTCRTANAFAESIANKTIRNSRIALDFSRFP